MADPALMYREFTKYTDLVSVDRIPNEDDIDFFIDKFLSMNQFMFYFEGTRIYCADGFDEVTKEVIYDKEGKSRKELEAEIKPLLTQKIKNTFGEVSTETNPFMFDPKPTTVKMMADMLAKERGVVDWDRMSASVKQNHPVYNEAAKEILKIKQRLMAYNQTVLPFTLRLTMHHNLGMGMYSTTDGKTTLRRLKDDGKPFTLNNEKDLRKFLDSKTMDGMFAGKHAGLRYQFWNYTNTGKDLKMAVIDLDNPAGIPKDDMRRAVVRIATKMEAQGHPYIIMYTGNNWHVWFGAKAGQPLGTLKEVQAYLKSLLFGVTEFTKSKAVEAELPLVDPAMYKMDKTPQAVRMFFSLHYQADAASSKEFTGLAAIPVPAADVMKLEPIRDAHPETVLANFDKYSALVAKFFDTVGMGQDYESAEDIEAPPQVIVHPEKFKAHPLLKKLNLPADMNKIRMADIETVLADEEQVYVYPKAKGLDTILVYDKQGGIKGSARKDLSFQRTVGTGNSKKLKTIPVTSAYITVNGNIIYDDYITRDLERIANAEKLSSIVISGQLVKTDALGNELGEEAVRALLQSTEGLTLSNNKDLSFIVNKVVSKNGKKVPIKDMAEEVSKLTGKRIRSLGPQTVTAPVGVKVAKQFKDLLRDRKVSTMLVENGVTYEINATRKISVAIIGMSKESKLYSNSLECPPVYVAVTKRDSSHGLVYYVIAKAEIALPKAERIKLREMIEGEEKRNIIPINLRNDDFVEQIEMVEPSVVVDVIYEDVGGELRDSFPTHFKPSERRGKIYRALVKKVYATPLIKPRVIGIREDMDALKPSDTDHRQDPLLVITGKIPKKLSLLDALPNPRSDYQQHVRKNPAFFGVQETRPILIDMISAPPTIEADSYVWDREVGEFVPSPDAGTRLVPQTAGGRTADIHLFEPKGRQGSLPGELQRAYQRWDRDEEGYKVFVDRDSRVEKDGVSHYRISSLGSQYQDAIDDQMGQGQDGFSVTTMDGTLEPIKAFIDQVNMAHLVNEKQILEDQKVVASLLRTIPGDPDSEAPISKGRKFDAGYNKAYSDMQQQMRHATTDRVPSITVHRARAEEIFNNPPIKAEAWNTRIDLFVTKHKEWEAMDPPKEPWVVFAQGDFMGWEVPLLEKERLLRLATSEYSLTERELELVDSQFGEPTNQDALESVLSDLYEEVPEDDPEEDAE
ncbi:MAG: hypothetical protein CMB45_05320 [Euryarchaeota archaeon]|nr:hypothetical protein [Euryarchaeota archaeon]MBK38393.1 hypothetical protein [Euryarchaeota archaeon]|tara:strand:+ start:3478 stop:7053 length:3576 start_codon:yes stop_codon:yes gene_type:complete